MKSPQQGTDPVGAVMVVGAGRRQWGKIKDKLRERK